MVEIMCVMMNQTIINPAPNEMKQDCIKVFKKDVTYMFSVQRLPAILVFARYGDLEKIGMFQLEKCPDVIKHPDNDEVSILVG
jgi:hypothetical protein